MISLENLFNMPWFKFRLGVLARHFSNGIDEKNPPFRLCRLVHAANHDACFHRRIVEKVRRKTNHGFNKIIFNKRLANVLFLFAEQNPMRKENRRAPRLRIHRLENMLNESIVSAALRRHSQEITSVWIIREELAIPLLDRIGRIGKNNIECLEVAGFQEAWSKQRIVVDDTKLLNAMQEEVHSRNRRGERVLLLPVCLNFSPVLGVRGRRAPRLTTCNA